ncbi:MAG: hypothetical protein U0796_01945 [Gemmatales bacterium]
MPDVLKRLLTQEEYLAQERLVPFKSEYYIDVEMMVTSVNVSIPLSAIYEGVELGVPEAE